MEKSEKYKNIDKSKALNRAQWLCSRQEKCSSSIFAKIIQWGVLPNEANEIIESLKSDGFINENRYALNFAREKARFSKWGPRKIEMALRAKRISDTDIEQALAEIQQHTSSEQLTELLTKKAKTIKHKDSYDLKNKLLRFGISRGFEYRHVLASVDEVVGKLKES